jgi:hypothetical protein
LSLATALDTGYIYLMTNNEYAIRSILSSFGATDITRPMTVHTVILAFTMSDADILTLMTAAMNDDLSFPLIFTNANVHTHRYSIDITSATI